ISGRVTSVGSLPENVYVCARPAREAHRGEEEGADVAPDGTFVCRVPVGLTYSIAAWRWTRTSSLWGAERQVAPDAANLELDLPEAGLLRLQLLDSATGKAVELRSRSLSRAVQLRPRSGAAQASEADADVDLQGGLELELAVGDYEVE